MKYFHFRRDTPSTVAQNSRAVFPKRNNQPLIIPICLSSLSFQTNITKSQCSPVKPPNFHWLSDAVYINEIGLASQKNMVCEIGFISSAILEFTMNSDH